MARVLLLPLTALVLASTGCGSGESGTGGSEEAVDARTWAESVCGSARDWVDETEARSEVFQTGEPLTSLEEARTMMVDFLDGAAADGDEAVAEIEAAGTPDVERGEERRDAFVGVVERNLDEVRARRDEFERLDPNDPQFQSDYEAILNRMGERMGFDEAFEGEVDPEVNEAFEEVEDCRTLREL
jgi:hypothetical protein